MASDDETSCSSSSSNSSSVLENAASRPKFNRVIELEIAEFRRVKNRKSIRMSASSTNDDLASYGGQLSKSKWRLSVDTSVLAADGSKKIGATIDLRSPCAMGVKASIDFGVISCDSGTQVVHMGTVKDVELVVQRSWSVTTSNYNPRLKKIYISHDKLDLPSDIIVRATITSEVISGGNLDAPANALISLGSSYTKFGPPDFTITSNDDVMFRVHRNHLTAMSSDLTRLMEEEADELEFDHLDSVQLGAILRTLYIQKDRDFKDAGQVLIAAQKFKLETLEKECLRSYLKGIDSENAYDALKFGKEYFIKDVNDRATLVIRHYLKWVGISNGNLIRALVKISNHDLYEVEEDISELMTAGAKTFTTTEVVQVLEIVRGKNFAAIEKSFIDKLSIAVKNVIMKNAVETLKLLSDRSLDQFKKQLIQRISENLEEFTMAKGFSLLSDQPDLIRAIQDAVTERKSKKPRVD